MNTPAAALPPLHDPQRVLPCPLASHVWSLGGDLLVAPKGHLLSLLLAVRRAGDVCADSLERVENGPERDALAHFCSMVEALRNHIVALMEEGQATAIEASGPAPEPSEVPS